MVFPFLCLGVMVYLLLLASRRIAYMNKLLKVFSFRLRRTYRSDVAITYFFMNAVAIGDSYI